MPNIWGSQIGKQTNNQKNKKKSGNTIIANSSQNFSKSAVCPENRTGRNLLTVKPLRTNSVYGGAAWNMFYMIWGTCLHSAHLVLILSTSILMGFLFIGSPQKLKISLNVVGCLAVEGQWNNQNYNIFNSYINNFKQT